MPLEREMLPDRSKARKKLLCAFQAAKAAHATLAFACRLMALLGPVVESGRRLITALMKAGAFAMLVGFKSDVFRRDLPGKRDASRRRRPLGRARAARVRGWPLGERGACRYAQGVPELHCVKTKEGNRFD